MGADDRCRSGLRGSPLPKRWAAEVLGVRGGRGWPQMKRFTRITSADAVGAEVLGVRGGRGWPQMKRFTRITSADAVGRGVPRRSRWARMASAEAASADHLFRSGGRGVPRRSRWARGATAEPSRGRGEHSGVAAHSCEAGAAAVTRRRSCLGGGRTLRWGGWPQPKRPPRITSAVAVAAALLPGGSAGGFA